MIDKARILHCAKRIAKTHALLDDEIDELFSAMGINRITGEEKDEDRKPGG